MGLLGGGQVKEGLASAQILWVVCVNLTCNFSLNEVNLLRRAKSPPFCHLDVFFSPCNSWYLPLPSLFTLPPPKYEVRLQGAGKGLQVQRVEKPAHFCLSVSAFPLQFTASPFSKG